MSVSTPLTLRLIPRGVPIAWLVHPALLIALLTPGSARGATSADFDGDGLVDSYEEMYGIDPLDADTDDDGLLDGTEVFGLTATDPLVPDTDYDGLLDGEEDADHDGAMDGGETHPLVADSDGDGVDDGVEVHAGTDPLNGGDDGGAEGGDGRFDSDGDGLSDPDEAWWRTDPWDTDTDGDGLWDGEEVYGTGTDPTLWDSDADGARDGSEGDVDIDIDIAEAGGVTPTAGLEGRAGWACASTGLGGAMPAALGMGLLAIAALARRRR